MSGSHLNRSWEISSVPESSKSGGAGKGNRNPAIYAGEKSDAPIVPKKPPNKVPASLPLEVFSAEAVEGRQPREMVSILPQAGHSAGKMRRRGLKANARPRNIQRPLRVHATR